MKKLFTLALVLLVTFAGYSQVKSVSKKDDMRKVATMQKATGMETLQNVQSEPNMTRSDGELDYTYYDWQTNCGIINRTIVWPDGKVNFAFTYASDDSFGDRGTAIGTYDSNNDVWIPMEGRVENEKTGFGSIARYKENGIVVAAHTSTECGIYIIEDKDNIAVNNTPCKLRLDPTIDPTWPVVMTSGPNRNIIHVLATAYSETGSPLYYFRSSDGGNSWDKQNEVIPYVSSEYVSDWGSNIAYWMETTENNRLAFVVNNAWSDGMVIYSDNDGETWERKVFYHHPGINVTYDDSSIGFMYPRWASCVWGVNGELNVAYEFNGTTGAPGSGSYYPGIGGVAFWGESMPYHGETLPEWGCDPTNPLPMEPGKPFIMDSAYLFEDIYASWWLWSDASHEMWPEYMGYLAPLDGEGNPEDPYLAEEFNIDDRTLHGSYNSGCVAMPTLCKLPESDYDLVAVWSAMDEQTSPETATGNYYYKLYASYSGDGGLTWEPQVALTKDFMQQYIEHVYTQAAVIGHTLIIACQTDPGTGTFVQEDGPEGGDNFYQGLTFDLNELFPTANVGVAETETNNHLSVYPNPAQGQINVTLNKSAEVTVYNIMGQVVMTKEGRAGANTLDISNLNSGIYFISAGNDIQKFIVK